MAFYVTENAVVQCSFGVVIQGIQVGPSRDVTTNNAPLANIDDTNLPPPGITCPPTAAAGAPQPCNPTLAGPWSMGKNNVLINGSPALLDRSTHTCNISGGLITITYAGQTKVKEGSF